MDAISEGAFVMVMKSFDGSVGGLLLSILNAWMITKRTARAMSTFFNFDVFVCMVVSVELSCEENDKGEIVFVLSGNPASLFFCSV